MKINHLMLNIIKKNKLIPLSACNTIKRPSSNERYMTNLVQSSFNDLNNED